MSTLGLFVAGAVVTLIVAGAISLVLIGAVMDGRSQRDRGSDATGSRDDGRRIVAAHEHEHAHATAHTAHTADIEVGGVT
jgi:hypothetical protein